MRKTIDQPHGRNDTRAISGLHDLMEYSLKPQPLIHFYRLTICKLLVDFCSCSSCIVKFLYLYNGRGAHIECSLRTDSTWEWMGKNHLETEYTIVMDIDDLVNGKITNLSAKCNYYSKQVADASVGRNVEECWSREELSASNIPLPDKSGKVVGNKSTGTTINSCTREHKAGWRNYKYSMLPSDDYSITVKFNQ